MAARRRLAFEPLNQLLLRLMRRMYAKVRKIQKERLILVPRDEVDRAIRQKIRQILPLRHFNRRVRLEIKMRARRFNRLVEPPLRRMMLAVVPKVPLAEHPSRIAGCLERIGDGDFFQRQLLHIVHRPQRPAPPIEPVDAPHRVHARSRSILPREESRPRRLAIRPARIAVGESHALRRHAVQVRRPVILAAVAGEIRVPQVIRQDEHNVRPPRLGGINARTSAQGA
jgi:hypothetical protein